MEDEAKAATHRSGNKVMNCDWTEKISLLIDGELDAREARAAEGHLADCAACRHAREDFLLMRGEINSYTAETDPVAQQQALRKILGVEAVSAGARGDVARDASSSSTPRGRRERLGVFALPRLSPALAAAVALLLVGVVIGIVMLRRSERAEVASGAKQGERAGANVSANTNASANGNAAVVTPAPAALTNEQAAKATSESRAAERKNVVRVESGAGGRGARVVTASASGRGANRAAKSGEEARQPKIVERLKLPVTPKLAVDPTELVETEIASLRSKVEPADLGTSQHVEQAQRLLRGFRNARVEGEPSASDIAYEKRRSRELLYRNIVLRREATARGDAATASLLDSLEPILIDIANLPDRPARDDVRAITERMRKKNIVAMLQVANGSRMY